ncbi:uncharacterized protein LOC128205996 [Mya arenaria]|uniref:uncharacterized protein LOC128205996 n=1 Tax=Mya arenaria TaxID=6604 RepID=UPI0022DF7629|nr:uncharacterized protein LOC128205996 [Mya arenaria]
MYSNSIPVLHKLHSVDFFYKDSVDLKSSMCENNFETYFKSLNCNQDDCFLIENSTKGQHKSYHWKNARAGTLTSSSFGTICKKKPETKPDILLRSIMGYNDEFDTAATRWGRSHEPAAKRLYQRRIQITHPGLKLFSSGLVVKPSLPHLGSSPDGIVDCCKKCAHTKGVLEIKCPYKFRNCSPEEACIDKIFCCSIVNGEVTLKKKTQLLFPSSRSNGLNRKKWCDFLCGL